MGEPVHPWYFTRAAVIHSYLRALALRFHEINAVEVGRLRMAAETSGYSTLHIASEPSVRRLVSIDVARDTEAVCRKVLPDVCLAKIDFVNVDVLELSGAYRASWPKFHFVYLDAANDADQGLALLRLFGEDGLAASGGLIIMDDTDHPGVHKGDKAVPYAREHTELFSLVEQVPRDGTCQGLTVLMVKEKPDGE